MEMRSQLRIFKRLYKLATIHQAKGNDIPPSGGQFQYALLFCFVLLLSVAIMRILNEKLVIRAWNQAYIIDLPKLWHFLEQAFVGTNHGTSLCCSIRADTKYAWAWSWYMSLLIRHLIYALAWSGTILIQIDGLLYINFAYLRCDLVIHTNEKAEKIASGSLNLFLAHLKVARDLIAKVWYFITLDPDPSDAPHGSPIVLLRG
jgi:hypothetical protein